MDATAQSGPVIACMNVKFSPNLGDGLLSECLEAALIGFGAGPGTTSIDLAARHSYGQQMAGRGMIMAALEALPGALRQSVVRLPLKVQSVRKWGPHYGDRLKVAQAVAIGGGNLITDLDLNFPTKLALAMDHVHRRSLPVAVFACGMGTTWSRAGLALMRRGFARPNLKAVFLRDAASKALWDDLLAPATGHSAVVVRDPGLLASEIFPQQRGEVRVRPRVGLGIMSHVAIRYHGEARITAAGLGRWYVDLARALIARGVEVVAFTNGSPEDVAAAEALRAALAELPGGVPMRTPATPAELAAIVAGCDAIAAYRMHAVIAAYSYGVPALALAWDPKLVSFMESVDRGDWVQDPATMPAEAAARLVCQAIDEGIDPEVQTRVLAEARRDVGLLYRALTGAG